MNRNPSIQPTGSRERAARSREEVTGMLGAALAAARAAFERPPAMVGRPAPTPMLARVFPPRRSRGPAVAAVTEPPAGPCPSPIHGETIAPWLPNGPEGGPVVQLPTLPHHPLDPGRPGTQTDILRPRRLK